MKKNFTKLILVFTLLISFNLTQAQIFTEDFDGGLPAEWMAVQNDASPVNASSNWVYTTTGPSGAFAGATGALASTTAANGWMMFDSDLNCSGNQDVWLISPSIDCTNFADVVVTYEFAYASFNDEIRVEVSTDNMASWTSFEVFPDAQANNVVATGASPGSNATIISSVAANQADVRFAFRFLSNGDTPNGGNAGGCGYNIQIDDIVVTDVDPTPMFDMRANDNFYAIAPSVFTPASQADTDGIGFLCDIENIGQQDVTGVSLNMTITDESGATVHTQDLDYGTVAAGFLDENRIMNERYVAPVDVVQIYTGTYTISTAETDEVPANNAIQFQFALSDSTFAKENGATGSVIPATAEGEQPWTAGTHYYVPNGDGKVCSSVLFGLGNADEVAGGNINVFLYAWDDVNNDNIAQGGERDGSLGGGIVGFASYTIGAADVDVQLALENWDDDELPVYLADDTHYILAIETFAPTGAASPVRVAGTGGFDYGAMSFLNDSLDILRNGSMWNTTETGASADLSEIGYAFRARMHVNDAPILDATSNQLAQENKVEIFPNPTADVLNLKLDFVETLDNVVVKIFDTTGKQVFFNKYNAVSQKSELINVSEFATGNYLLHITTPEGVRTERFVVSK